MALSASGMLQAKTIPLDNRHRNTWVPSDSLKGLERLTPSMSASSRRSGVVPGSSMKDPKSPSVCVVGLGYVGLTTATCFSSRGIHVIGIDVDEARVKKINAGESVLKEPGLEPLVKRGFQSGCLEVDSSFSQVSNCEIIFVTVGTPSLDDGSIDTSYVEDAAGEIGKSLRSVKRFRVVVVKSTVVPGTTWRKVKPMLEFESRKRVGDDLGLGVNPEFLFEGSAVEDTMNPEALVLGTADERTKGALLRLYGRFYGRLPKVISTTPENAELMKYAINSFRAVQVSYVNFLANLCFRVERGEWEDISKGLAEVGRLDRRYLGPGTGFGGSCLPKDSKALKAFAESVGVEPAILGSAIRTNEVQHQEVIRMAEKLVGNLKGRRVAVLGLAFKGGTDDVRDSTSIEVVHSLLRKGASVSVFDPAAMDNARGILGTKVRYAETAEKCIAGADVCVIATGWDSFRTLRPSSFKSFMRSPLVVDGRRVFQPEVFKKSGVRLLRVGTAPFE